MKNSVSYFAIIAVSGMMGSVAFAADAPASFEEKFDGVKPAVSGINGKIEAAYTYVGTGFGAAVHAFWRNPDTALLGFYGDVVRYDTDFGPDVTTWRYGAEGELYLDRVSLEGFIGGDTVDAGGFNETYFSAEAMAAFYVTDDFRIHAGVGHRFDDTFGRVGAEAMLPFAGRNVALFGDGTFGDDVTTARAGLRVYFGEAGKSLKDRHRQDDPRIRLFDVFGGSFESGDDAKTPPSCGESCT